MDGATGLGCPASNALGLASLWPTAARDVDRVAACLSLELAEAQCLDTALAHYEAGGGRQVSQDDDVNAADMPQANRLIVASWPSSLRKRLTPLRRARRQRSRRQRLRGAKLGNPRLQPGNSATAADARASLIDGSEAAHGGSDTLYRRGTTR